MELNLTHLGEDYCNAQNNILLNTNMRAYRSVVTRYLGDLPIE